MVKRDHERDQHEHEHNTHHDKSFGLVDVLRVLAGVLALNCVFSWWFTSSSTWGYEGKWLDARFLKFELIGDYVDLTVEQLALYNGTDPSLPIYVGVYGKVYDVTSGHSIYGPNGPYKFFSGKDSARAFSTGCFNKPDEFTYDLRGLDMEEASADIAKWQRFFDGHNKYWYVGSVKHSPITGDPPDPCEHMKYPGHRR